MDDKKTNTIQDVAAERDRYIARNAELEDRLERMRQISLGLVHEHLGAIVGPRQADLTIKKAQAEQPWQGEYSNGVLAAYREGVPHILGAHNALHVAKTAGKLAAVFEELDHPADQYTALGAANLTDAQLQTVKDMAADLVTEALRFANLYGFDLETELRRRVAKQNPTPVVLNVAAPFWVRFNAAEFPTYAKKCTGKARAAPFGKHLPLQDGEMTQYDIRDGELHKLGLFWPSAHMPGPREHGPESFQSLEQWLDLEVKP